MTITVARLTEWVRESERVSAPGSESALWGEYLEAMRQLCGTTLLDESDHPVYADEASWWMGACCAEEAVAAGGYTDPEEYHRLMPREPQEGDWEWIIDRMGDAHDADAVLEGYAYVIEREEPGD